MKTLEFILRNVKPKERAILYNQGVKARDSRPLSSNPHIGLPARIWAAGWKGEMLDPKKLEVE